MLLSVALILLGGIVLGALFRRINLPELIGMMLAGIVLGPYVLNWLDINILEISAELRSMALVIILTRAGLGLNISQLKSLGRPAVLMCFLPAFFEIAGITLFGPHLLRLSFLESALLGSVLAAVSPAVVVPRMVNLMEKGYGEAKGIPQLVLAGASVDDVVVMVLFSTFLAMMQGQGVSIISFVNVPFSILAGALMGMLLGLVLSKWVHGSTPQSVYAFLILLSLSFMLVATENSLNTSLTFSAYIAIIFLGVAIQRYAPDWSVELSQIYNNLWIPGQIFLFALLGSSVDINYLPQVGWQALLLIAVGLAFRMVGVLICLLQTNFTQKEKLFTMIAYTPKATVQAAIGGIPLSLGLASGETILAVAVLSIIVTAPLGAFAIDSTYSKLLEKPNH